MMARILSIIISLSLVLIIFGLVRGKKLKQKYAILWLATGITILIFAFFEKALIWLTRLLGIQTPINTLFFLGIIFIILINLHFSVIISNLTEQNKKIAQKLALLDEKIKNPGVKS
ncbi:MAG: DUF2304 domain-containing protein [Candidatus Omnitrophica bacterium]|nr:DUF2304 domain-containing protein [Candidatus Omnitrophota bacterium]MBU1924751.1 DUF2304 domain-containing protein [Candidatus Omnitrophota bacterium]